MKRFALTLALFITAALNFVVAQEQPPAQSQGTNTPLRIRNFGGPADKASPRRDTNSMLAHVQLVEKAKKGGIDIYFEGDSIARRWGTSDAQYKANYENWTNN